MNSPIVSKIRLYLKDKHYIDNVPFISVGILAGTACCIYAIVFSRVEKLGALLMEENLPVALFLSPLFFVLSFFIVQKIAPGASGSGIPQVMACIEKSHSHLASIFLNLKVLAVKVISSVLVMFAGGGIGREGPSLQISAAIAHSIGLLFKKVGITVKTDQLYIAGAASGLAAAFNTPIGGIVYAIEELSHEHMKKYKDVLLLAVVIAGFTAQLLIGNYLYLGYPKVRTSMSFGTLLTVSIVSVMAGILGAIFSKLLTRLIAWRFLKTFKQLLFIAGTIGLAMVGIYYFFGARAIFSGNESINFILFAEEEIPFSEVLFRFTSPLLTSMTGVAGGIFAPSLSAGAVFGGMMAQLTDPSLRTILGLSGMIGFLTGVTRSPITSFVLVFEMTDRHSAVLGMMFAAFFSSLGSNILGDKSFYETSVDNIKATHK